MPNIIIPARYASSRFPGKAVALLKGRPMIHHVACRALAASRQVTVATDDQRIADAVRDLPVKVVFTDPDLPSGTDRVAAAARELKLDDNAIIVNLQGDLPAIAPELITLTAAPMQRDGDIAMATAVIEQDIQTGFQDPNSVKAVLDGAGNALYFSRSPIPYDRSGQLKSFYHHIGLYVFRNWLLQKFVSLPVSNLEQIEGLEQLRVLEAGYKIRCVVSSYSAPAEVNTPEDVALVSPELH